MNGLVKIRNTSRLSPVSLDTISRWGADLTIRRPLRAVVFDFGMVIANFYFRSACKRICIREGWRTEADIKRVEACLTDPMLKGDFERGRINTRQFYSAASEQLGLKRSDFKYFVNAWNNILTFREDTKRFGAELTSMGIKTFILSDTNEAHYSFFRPLSEIVAGSQAQVLSHQTGFYKSDGPHAFLKMISTLKDGFSIDPASAIYFDDRADYVATAVGCGLPGMQFNNAQDARLLISDVWGLKFGKQ